MCNRVREKKIERDMGHRHSEGLRTIGLLRERE